MLLHCFIGYLPQAYGYELPKDIEYVYTHVRKTHNTGVFDAYTDEMKRARKSGILTGVVPTRSTAHTDCWLPVAHTASLGVVLPVWHAYLLQSATITQQLLQRSSGNVARW